MKKTLRLFLAAGLAAAALPAMAATALTDADFLKANGRNLRKNYGTGDLVQLKGTNLGGWLVQEFWMTPTAYSTGVSDEQDIYDTLSSRFGESVMQELVDVYQDAYITESDFDNMASMGMNCVRLPFWWRNLTDASGNLKTDWYKRLDWAIAQAKARGMYVVVDFHGAPGSQNGSDHSGVDGGDDKQGASRFFFGDDAAANQELYYSLWETVVTRYKDEPAVAAYDLLNEPYCTYRYSSGYTDAQLRGWLWTIYDNAYKRIRAIDPDHVIIMEATWNPVDLPDPATYGWTNVMYEYHNYLYDDYDNAAGNQISNMRSKLNSLLAAAYDVPSYMGEFCYFNNIDAWDEGLALLTNSGINWTTWTYKVVSTYGNWGLVNQNVTKVNCTTDDEATIRANWGKVGSSYNNTNLVEVAIKYFNQTPVKNTFGPAESETATRYESEQATIVGGAAESQSFYSAGSGVGGMNTATAVSSIAADWSGMKYVEYAVTVPRAGVYSVTLAYNGAGSDGMLVATQVNGGATATVTLNNSGAAWNAMSSTSFQVSLNEGTNAVRVSGTLEVQSNWANQDYIEVEFVGIDVARARAVTATVMDIARAASPGLAGWTRYEGEAAEISGGAAESQSFYSGGKAAGGLNSATALADVAVDWSNIKYVKFTVTVPAAGTYRVLLQYNGDNDKTILVKTAEDLQAVAVPAARSTHDWNALHVALLDVPMAEGANALYISGTVGDIATWLNVDCIDVCRIPFTEKAGRCRYEAEYGVIKANRTTAAESQSFYSNLWGVGGMGSGVAQSAVKDDLSNVYYTSFPLFAAEAGDYNVALAYNGNGADMTAKYRLNNAAAEAYTLANSGKSWNDMNTVNLFVPLNQGMNSITLAGSSTGSWSDWVNFDYVEVWKPASSVSAAGVAGAEWTARGARGGALVSSPVAMEVSAYTVSGALAGRWQVPEGGALLPLGGGLYVLTGQGGAVKVLVP